MVEFDPSNVVADIVCDNLPTVNWFLDGGDRVDGDYTRARPDRLIRRDDDLRELLSTAALAGYKQAEEEFRNGSKGKSNG